MASVFCTQCGHSNAEDAKFCSACGAPLQAATRDATTMSLTAVETGETAEESGAGLDSAIEALPPGSAMLVVRRGPSAGSRFLLDQDLTTAGRHPQSDIFLDDVTVSRRHAELVRTADGFRARDVGSLNGTYVNRDRIDEADLASGDEVQIGKFRLVFYTGRAGARP